MKLQDWFNLGWLTSKQDLTVAIAVRLFGIDAAVIVSARPRDWTLFAFHTVGIPERCLLFLTLLGANLYIGRNSALYA